MIYNEFKKTVSDHFLIEEGDKIVVGLSGGPDSICLTHLLYRLSKEMDIKIYAVHLNHQIRGLDAHLDALYVHKFCENLEIPSFIKSIDVPKYCEENKLGLEEGARKLRYEIFSEVGASVGAKKIAVGHNKNDQAETILMRIMRGTGLKGLQGIRYKRADGVIRPILDIERKDIEAYCESRGLRPRIDSTNLEDFYSRNKIRLRILPYMKSEFNENIIEAITRMGKSLSIDSRFIDSQVDSWYKDISKKTIDGVYIFSDKFSNLHEAIKRRTVIKAIEDVLGDVVSIDKKHIDEVIELEESGKIYKSINLPRGLFVYRQSGYILFSKNKIEYENASYEYKVSPNSSIFIAEINKTFKSDVINFEEFEKKGFEKNIQYIDFDKINGDLTLRNRRQGDKIRLSGGTKKVKDFFVGLKIPREDRSFVPMLINQGRVVSVLGHRINVDYKIDNKTRRILRFSLE